MNESYDFEDRKYVNPTVSRDEQLAFIDNLRSTQQQGMNEIVRDTHNLGTDVPSNLGGLNGSTSVWNQQYVEPRMNTMVSGLRATAQAQALSDVLSNYQNQMKKRYNDAYRAANKRSNNKSNSNSNGTTGGSGTSLNDGTKINGDGSGTPKETVDVDEAIANGTATAEDYDAKIATLEGQLKPKQNQFEQLKKNGRYAGYSDWEKFASKLSIVGDIANANVYAGKYNKLKGEIEALEKQINELYDKKGQLK